MNNRDLLHSTGNCIQYLAITYNRKESEKVYTHTHTHAHTHTYGLLRLLGGKESTCNAGASRDAGSIPGLGRFPGGGHSKPLQYSCLENPMDRGDWQSIG